MSKNISICQNCQKPLTGFKRKYCSTKCKNIILNQFFQCYKNKKSRATQRKLEVIKPFGSKCSKCGYNRNLSALCFHHLDPKTKSFEITQRELANRTKEAIEKETQKCILLCSNCHMELHHPHDMVAEDGTAPSEVSL